jgi:low affinity Fe/Cu permease
VEAAFSYFAKTASYLVGTWEAFVAAVILVAVWLLAGFYFGFADQLYQLFINTTTTVITFLVVFLLQHSQNRDTLAIQIKLDELILTHREANNQIVRIEDLTESELRTLRERREQRERLGIPRNKENDP